ncbi:adenosine 5'-monophosphoramidase HINT3-like isoform X1 [Dermacentor albipictus]|uniref:adenosine 5'-monophosphoramidase HINT3-like isoform X1 n=1 Tax=Dermacentor albipictus TaxID=60249 RepID=UPI0038FC2F48
MQKRYGRRRRTASAAPPICAIWGKTPETGAAEGEASGADACVFCKIVAGKDPKATLLYQDEDYVVFPDIHPASAHHYLVVPKKHVKNVKSLTHNDIPLVNRLVEIGKQVLEERSGSMDSSRMGFHWPPFTSISHLHLHVISPVADMSTLASIIFMPRMPWFSVVEDTVAYLERSRPPAS